MLILKRKDATINREAGLAMLTGARDTIKMILYLPLVIIINR